MDSPAASGGAVKSIECQPLASRTAGVRRTRTGLRTASVPRFASRHVTRTRRGRPSSSRVPRTSRASTDRFSMRRLAPGSRVRRSSLSRGLRSRLRKRGLTSAASSMIGRLGGHGTSITASSPRASRPVSRVATAWPSTRTTTGASTAVLPPFLTTTRIAPGRSGSATRSTLTTASSVPGGGCGATATSSSRRLSLRSDSLSARLGSTTSARVTIPATRGACHEARSS